MQRNGRKGHAMFRMVVQDSRRTPTSGRVVAYLGSYDPHAKKIILDKEKAGFYLEHGARPSTPVIRLFKAEKVKLPKWVSELSPKAGKIKNPDKRRSTSPKNDEPEVIATTKDQEPETTIEEAKVDDNNKDSPVEASEESIPNET